MFRDGTADTTPKDPQQVAEDKRTGYTAFTDPDDFLVHVLSFLETPQYLRRRLFGFHPNLRTAGALPSTDMPHHLKGREWCLFRDGVTVSEREASSWDRLDGEVGAESRSSGNRLRTHGQPEVGNVNGGVVGQAPPTAVFTGMPFLSRIPVSFPPNTRVTLRFETEKQPPALDPCHTNAMIQAPEAASTSTANAVAPETPRTEAGYYWGYTIRQASCISKVFTESPFSNDGGYDFAIGTSERGTALGHSNLFHDKEKQKFKHLLVAFGGTAGLEAALAHDEDLKGRLKGDTAGVFDAYVDLFEKEQGSKTVRTEEAVWCGLMALRPWILSNGWDGGEET